MEYEKIIRSYIEEPVRSVVPLAGGHINRSFLVEADERYVLQCMKGSLFAENLDVIADNYTEYKRVCDRFGSDVGKWVCPDWLRSDGGGFFHMDPGGNIWRMYRYIPSDEKNGHSGSGSAHMDTYTAGEGLGKLHYLMRKCEGIRECTEDHRLFDLSYHYGRYEEQSGSKMQRSDELDRYINENIESMMRISLPAGYVIHGDAKLSNMIFDNGQVIGFVDLDTIMPGSIFDDIADCIRSCCTDGEGRNDPARMARFLEGYRDGCGIFLTEDAVHLIGRNVARCRFMLGIRYYTDYLSEENYFADVDAKRKLERACKLLTD